jgi:hypothetical protein
MYKSISPCENSKKIKIVTNGQKESVRQSGSNKFKIPLESNGHNLISWGE